ncbi:MAG: ABC transporter permease subunit [Candidatus Poribacteria bacterium]|nr:ABC transporter permease subunit [Candidatus Poribacteria bacterium]
MWHIAKRELYDNLNSLRFALTTVLLLALMLTNAVVHLQKHPKRIQKYRASVTKSLNDLTARGDSLYDIAQQGPGLLYKKPSALRFCADGGEAFLPGVVGGAFLWSISAGNGRLKGFWRLDYPAAAPNLINIRPDVTKVDWGFIIGYILSLIALLFTFDSISGEREHGTLRLMLANPIPRHTVLIGKFLGALISISIPLSLAVLMNLLVISMSSDVHLGANAWGRLGIIFLIAILYLCLFLALGLLVSARVQRRAVSLVILLLAWVIFVVFMPSTLAAIVSGFSSPMSTDELWKRRGQLYEARFARYDTHLPKESEPSKRMQFQGEHVIQEAQEQERLSQAQLAQKIDQAEFARTLTRISPVAIVQHLLESFAGTGFNRHLQFIENTQRYARQFREFVADTDRADPESLHIIGVREGMSQKPVSPEAVPKFEDTLSLSRDFNAAAVDLLLLTLFVIVLLSGAYLAFVRVEV